MSIILPTTPGIRSATPSLISYGGLLSPSLGGAVQRLNRLGDRHALKVSLPPMRSEPDGRIYASRSEEHTSELQSLMRISYAVFCLKKKNTNNHTRDKVNYKLPTKQYK